MDFPALLAELRAHDFQGWAVVEQDILPDQGMDALASARRNREYLPHIGFEGAGPVGHDGGNHTQPRSGKAEAV